MAVTAKFFVDSITTGINNQTICLRQGNTTMPGQRANDYGQSAEGNIYLTAEPGKPAYNYFEVGKLYTLTLEKV
jgi:hypothetical protein